jgi:hypothetical protein
VEHPDAPVNLAHPEPLVLLANRAKQFSMVKDSLQQKAQQKILQHLKHLHCEFMAQKLSNHETGILLICAEDHSYQEINKKIRYKIIILL